jgi:hypothetical protein
MLVSRCSSQLSSHQNYERNQKSHKLVGEKRRNFCQVRPDSGLPAAMIANRNEKFGDSLNDPSDPSVKKDC